MSTPPEELKLAAEFPAADLTGWRELVTGVLDKQGRTPADPDAPEQELAATTYDDLTIAPLYTAETRLPAAGMPGVAPYVRGATPQGSVAGGWDVRAGYADADAKELNDSVLADLEHGVSSLWLRVGAGGVAADELSRALQGVLLDLAPVVLDAGADYEQAATALLDCYTEQQVPASEVRAVLGIDPLGVAARTGSDVDVGAAAEFAVARCRDYPALRTMLVDGTAYHDAGSSDAQELGYSIATGVAYLRALTEAGLEIDEALRQLEFRYSITDDQFLGIAKLRAARRLWSRVATECSAAPESGAQHQHAVTALAMMTERDPWVNMLRTTVACFAAGVGGAESVTVRPFDTRLGIPDSFARRIARNTQAILLEESKLAGVIDPAGGSWYVESLTDALAHAAWQVFTGVEAEGGMAAALASGAVAQRVGEVAGRRASNVAKRSDPITGVSEFPNLDERRLERRPHAGQQEAVGLAPVYYAQDFERLRTRCEEHAAEHGARPTVFLATLGPIAKHTARATFARNLFNAGGIETVQAGATEDAEQVLQAFEDASATVVCICGGDASYGEYLPALANRLAERGAARVLLAGKPDEESGVDGFVHIGCDALGILRETLETLGVR